MWRVGSGHGCCTGSGWAAAMRKRWNINGRVFFMWIFGGMKMGRGHGFSRARGRLHERRFMVAVRFDSTSRAMTFTDRLNYDYNEIHFVFYFPILLLNARRRTTSAAIDNTN